MSTYHHLLLLLALLSGGCGQDGASPLEMGAPSDLATPDSQPVPDLARADLSLPDMALPDLALPDLGLPDLAPAPGDMGIASFQSCIGLVPTCGPLGNESCCSTAQTIPGGTFFRSYDVALDGAYPDMSNPATVSSFSLDKYEITVGRFRKFVAAVNTGWRPTDGIGAHPHLAGSGWNYDGSSWPFDAAHLVANLSCSTSLATWTDLPGANENRAMNCITWYEAFAFCTWDGGYLPTEAEWNYAASGGSEQRAYPWSSPADSMTIDCSYANYYADTYCSATRTNDVGSDSPTGDGKWGHSDLGGNLWEWNLDWDGTYPNPCIDCANLPTSFHRELRGGFWGYIAPRLRSAYRDNNTPTNRGGNLGGRCAWKP